jgi:hypothetical protein
LSTLIQKESCSKKFDSCVGWRWKTFLRKFEEVQKFENTLRIYIENISRYFHSIDFQKLSWKDFCSLDSIILETRSILSFNGFWVIFSNSRRRNTIRGFPELAFLKIHEFVFQLNFGQIYRVNPRAPHEPSFWLRRSLNCPLFYRQMKFFTQRFFTKTNTKKLKCFYKWGPT